MNKELKKLIELSELNKNQFAKKIGVSPQYIGQMVNERQICTMKTLKKFSKKVGVDIDVVFSTKIPTSCEDCHFFKNDFCEYSRQFIQNPSIINSKCELYEQKR